MIEKLLLTAFFAFVSYFLFALISVHMFVYGMADFDCNLDYWTCHGPVLKNAAIKLVPAIAIWCVLLWDLGRRWKKS